MGQTRTHRAPTWRRSASTLTLALVAVVAAVSSTRVGHASASDVSGGQALYNQDCLGCHGDPTDPAPGQTIKKIPGARGCAIYAAINGNPRAGRQTPYPNGVPEMDWLKGKLTYTQLRDIADYLNSFPVTGQQRYVTTCADCHGADASGGFVGVNVQGARTGEIIESILDEEAMNFLWCLRLSDSKQIGQYLGTLGRSGTVAAPVSKHGKR